MRQIDYIVIHCTATSQDATVYSIKEYWKKIGWNNPGYHYLIDPKGITHNLQDESKIANGVKGHNGVSIHVSYIGGVDSQNKPIDNRTPQQLVAMKRKIKELREKYPSATVLGHRDFGVPKACPSFDVAEWLNTI